jgi:hypothetical protein
MENKEINIKIGTFKISIFRLIKLSKFQNTNINSYYNWNGTDIL